MDHPTRTANFIWNIADDVLHDICTKSKYRDIIIPMVLLCRLDAVLQGSRAAVLKDAKRASADEKSLCKASGQAFYNSSGTNFNDLRALSDHQELGQRFFAWIDGFSANVLEIVDSFEFRSQVSNLIQADALSALVEKFSDSRSHLGPQQLVSDNEEDSQPGIDNCAMAHIFGQVLLLSHGEAHAEAGEHWTPPDVVDLMAKLACSPVADKVEAGASYRFYDGAFGTGNLLRTSAETLQRESGSEISTELYGQEINRETYAIAKAGFMLRGQAEATVDLVGGPGYSSLANDVYSGSSFDFIVSSPLFGKGWKIDLEHLGGKVDINDPRFVGRDAAGEDYSLVTRASDGQLMFLANLVSKMNHNSPLGSRIVELHNGSSLFTGEAGQGESNIRRWVIENDWLEAVVALPANMLPNTATAAHLWVLTNKKPPRQRGKVILIDASEWGESLGQPLGHRLFRLPREYRDRIVRLLKDFKETEESVIQPNAAFGYWRVTVERPLRLAGIERNRLYRLNEIRELREQCETDPDAPPVLRKIHRQILPNPLYGLFETVIEGQKCVVEYESDTELRDAEQVPLLEQSGIEAFVRREVLPYAPDAWIRRQEIRIGYEINFHLYFSRPQQLSTINQLEPTMFSFNEGANRIISELLGNHD